MQISPVNFCGYYTDRATGLSNNQKEILKLENKQAELEWASEGCNASLSPRDSYELSLRRELEGLVQRHNILQGMCEGCNASLPEKDIKRMNELMATLREISESKNSEPQVDKSKYDDVPASTYYGDWAN